jgi:transcriptional regulator with XRE-family HTH domain
MTNPNAIALRITAQLGDRLRTARERQGLSQQAAAGKSGLDLRFWQRLEKGRRGLTIKTLVRAATALGLTFWDLTCPDRAHPEQQARPPRRRRSP